MIKSSEINAWAESLLIDKQYGIGVSSIYCDREEDVPQGYYRTTIDDLDELDKMLICRVLGEPIWEIDFELWTLDSLKANGYGEKDDTVADMTVSLDIAPYMPRDLEVMANLHKIGSVQQTEYMTKENEWYKNLREKFDEMDNSETTSLDELIESCKGKVLE